MQPDKKPDALGEWHRSFKSSTSWANPSSNYRYLMRMADGLMQLGQIDAMERFELVELATGAYCHHIEDCAQPWKLPGADYAIYNEAGVQTGSLSGNRVYLHNAGGEPNPADFFAQIHYSADGGDSPVITRTYAHYGVFRDRYIITATGQTLTLVETSRMVNGETIYRLDDPDTYRSIVDAALIALEEGDMVRYVALWERENFSIFRQCSSCCDRFELREDCKACAGLGFVEDPQCPSKLPPSLRGCLATEGSD